MRSISLIFIAAALASAQPGLIVQNAASYQQGQAAPGSLIVISNALINPGTATVTILPAGANVPVPIPLVQGWIGRLPGTLPDGPAIVSVSAGGQLIGTVSISIVSSSFGVFTHNSGRGPVLAQNFLTHPAKPGDYVTLWGTGLGSATQDQVTVLLGGLAARVTYAGPAPGDPGTDQINFQVPLAPAVPFGCYVAVSVTAARQASNTATLSTSSDGSACQSPLGLSSEELGQLDAGQSLYLGQVNIYDMVARPVTEWFMATGYTRMESANALFLSLDAANAAVLVDPLEIDDAYYSCYSIGSLTAAFLGSGGSSSPTVTLSSGSKSLTFTTQAQIPAPPIASTPGGVDQPFFSAGEWTASIGGNTGVLNVPQPLRISNLSALATISRAHDLTVTWNGGDYTSAYTATLQLNGSSVLVCRAPANSGSITIPAGLLKPLTAASGSLELLLVPRAGRITTFPVTLSSGVTAPTLFRYFPSEVIPVVIE